MIMLTTLITMKQITYYRAPVEVVDHFMKGKGIFGEGELLGRSFDKVVVNLVLGRAKADAEQGQDGQANKKEAGKGTNAHTSGHSADNGGDLSNWSGKTK